MYCIIKCIVQGKQARVKNADLRHPSCTVVMQKRKSASPVLNVLRRNERDAIKNICRSECKVIVIIIRFVMKFEVSRLIFEKYSKTKFNENPFSGIRVVPCGRTWRHKTKASSRFSQCFKIR